MLSLIQQEPLWKSKRVYRLGEYYRENKERFIFVASRGWFIHLRGEYNLLSGLHSSSNIAGPFTTKTTANHYLQTIIAQSFNDSA